MIHVEAGTERCDSCGRYRNWLAFDGVEVDRSECIFDSEEAGRVALIEWAERLTRDIGIKYEKNPKLEN